MIKVLLAEDHSLVRAGLCRLVDESGHIEVVAEAEDGKQALDLIRKVSPDVAVIDISMPAMDGFELLAAISSEFPSLPVIVLTMHEEPQYVVRAISSGAKGYITKRSAPEQLVEAIGKVYGGGLFLTSFAAEALAINAAGGGKLDSPLEELSNREIQVLRRLAMGQMNREIAEALSISIKTVDTYRQRILKKLGLRNNAELSRFAIKQGLVDL
ncbi:MAG: DNA-binding response regulator [Deltaproteobacteria bacterium]|nr:MAG: DNA-binding response regulator [Deltaproteobacteria bacterium]